MRANREGKTASHLGAARESCGAPHKRHFRLLNSVLNDGGGGGGRVRARYDIWLVRGRWDREEHGDGLRVVRGDSREELEGGSLTLPLTSSSLTPPRHPRQLPVVVIPCGRVRAHRVEGDP